MAIFKNSLKGCFLFYLNIYFNLLNFERSAAQFSFLSINLNLLFNFLILQEIIFYEYLHRLRMLPSFLLNSFSFLNLRLLMNFLFLIKIHFQNFIHLYDVKFQHFFMHQQNYSSFLSKLNLILKLYLYLCCVYEYFQEFIFINIFFLN